MRQEFGLNAEYKEISGVNDNIIKSMSLQGFKNLINRSLLLDESIQPLQKKSDEYRKITQTSIDHYQIISKNFEAYYQSYDKILFQLYEEVEANNVNMPQYYHQYVQLYRNINAELKIFTEKTSGSFKELTSVCSNLLGDFSNLILNFQQVMRGYQSNETILFELSKKYFRSQKNMMGNIQSYKSSFTDVKLIYNMDQKIKRYTNCEICFKGLNEELAIITDKTDQLNAKKQNITNAYKHIEKELIHTLKTIATKLIAETKKFVTEFCQMHKIIITFLAERKFTLQKIELKTFFSSVLNIKDEEYFDCKVDEKKCEIFPSFIIYHTNIKEEYLPNLNKMLLVYFKQIYQKTEQRKFLNKRIYDFTLNFFKLYERANYTNLKEVIAHFERIKKRLSDVFGNRLLSFIKSINSIFQLSIGINEKLLKRIATKNKAIEQYIAEEVKLLELFSKELKTNIQKFMNKKEVIKSNSARELQFTQEEPSSQDLEVIRKEIAQKSEFIVHLIEGFASKMKKNYQQVKFHYNGLVNDISLSINEFYSLCCEYQEMYFGQEEFNNNFKKYQIDIDTALLKETQFFKEINFGVILKEQGKITFDAEISKVEQFKKIKKPIEIEYEENKEENVMNIENESEKKEKGGEIKQMDNKSRLSRLSSNNSIKEGGELNGDKHEEFIFAKIPFFKDEKFVKSYSCGLYDKIILQGRIYVTNKRICFHSKFNPSTVFFGETFIQIPKKDIKKIEKRHNAIFFDNSISITTINGEVFFTSFFSRNEAFQTIFNAMDCNADEFIFEPEEQKGLKIQEVAIIEEDDLNEQLRLIREEKLLKMLNVFEYKILVESELTFPDFNALKLFKMFEIGQDLLINRKTYPTFLHYYKNCLEHKQCQFGDWTPNIKQFINSGNLKHTIPEKFQRRLFAMVPIANSGVPFMPKAARSEENQTLYFFSKDKYVIESIIQNSGVPYADCFNLRLKKTIETISQNRCRMSTQLFINFTQNTMMKSIIQSKSAEETKIALTRLDDEMQKYLRNLQKKNKQSKNKQGSNEIEASNNEEYEKEIESLREQQSKTVGQLNTLKSKLDFRNKIVICSIILNILLILIVLS